MDHRRADEEELHSRADAAHGAASGERNPGGGSMPQAGDHRTNLLQVEAASGGHGDRGAGSAATVGRRVLIAYDGSDGSHAALEDLQLAGLGKNVKVTILSVAEVWLPPETSLGIDKPFPAYTPPEVRKAHEIAAQGIEKMGSVANEAKTRLQSISPSWEIRTEVRSGSPSWEVINRANELETNLIIVGSHGRLRSGDFSSEPFRKTFSTKHVAPCAWDVKHLTVRPQYVIC